MKRYRVRITRQAHAHLREIYRHISQELMSPIAAENTLARLYKEICSLDNMPKRIPLTPETKWNVSPEIAGMPSIPLRLPNLIPKC